MKIKTITVEYKITENLGNYSNITISTHLTADLEEGDLEEVVMLALREKAEANVKNGIQKEVEKRKGGQF